VAVDCLLIGELHGRIYRFMKAGWRFSWKAVMPSF